KCTYRLKVGAVTGKLALNLIYSTKPHWTVKYKSSLKLYCKKTAQRMLPRDTSLISSSWSANQTGDFVVLTKVSWGFITTFIIKLTKEKYGTLD
ncbi:hypothetical protein ACK6T8_24510, partial [Klebsiella pneumoniae]|uniref:hypothetical protein n=1 Tax=Klebsiella pneumoniae TaxID=573 RepID=UPI0039B68308